MTDDLVKLKDRVMVMEMNGEHWVTAEDYLALETENKRLREALEPGNGRPCATDQFLAVAAKDIENDYQFVDAVEDWIDGNFTGALKRLSENARAALKGEPK